MSDGSKIKLCLQTPVARVVLDRSERLNALDPQMLDELEAAIVQAERSAEVRVFLLETANEKAFSAGADIFVWTTLSPLAMWSEWVRRGHRVFDRLERARQPVICAIQGYTYGGGLELALACDLRIAADSARFALPEVKLADVPGWGGTDRLPRLIGSARAKQMILTGEPITAEVAERWGLVNEVVPAASLTERVRALAEQIAANAPLAVQTAKPLIAGPAAVTLEALAVAVNAFNNEVKEGLAAFREKRPPQFQSQ